MQFEWKTFMDRHHLPYVDRGPNVARNHIGINCPFCGNDTGEHMGLSLNPKRPAWGCWRNHSHRGVNPTRLIKALLNCSEDYAASLVRQASVPEMDAFETVAARLTASEDVQEEEVRPTKHQTGLPVEFKKLTPQGSYGRAFYDYLLDRNFSGIHSLAKHYDLRYCLTGAFKWRIIIPIWYRKTLISWTGRDITGQAELRYKTLSHEAEAAKKQGYLPASKNIKLTVFNQEEAEKGGEVLVVVEGPMDFIRMDWYKNRPGMVVVGCFGKPDEAQIMLIARLARKFDRVASLLDADALGDAVSLAAQLEELSGTPARWVPLPYGLKDPGEMPTDLVEKFAQTL